MRGCRVLDSVIALAVFVAGCGSVVAPEEVAGTEVLAGQAQGAGRAVGGGGTTGAVGAGLGAASSGVAAAQGVGSAQPVPRPPTIATSAAANIAADGGGGEATSGITTPTADEEVGAPAPSAAATPDADAAGMGFDAEHAYIGVVYTDDFSAVAENMGGREVDTGDLHATYEAIIAGVNAAGGVLGRELVAVPYNSSTAAGASDPDGDAQAACSAFTEDHQVFGAVVYYSQTMFGCLDAAGVSYAQALTLVVTDAAALAEHAPHYYEPAVMAFEHLAPTWVDRLAANGYFNGGAKVGLLHTDNPAATRSFDVLEQMLAARGVSVSARFAYGEGMQGAVGDSQAAVLQFASAGVDHVLADNGNVVFFMTAADAQAYQPRYGLTTYNNLATVLTANAPPSQLHGAIGVGWSPNDDVSREQDPGDVGPGETQCRQTLQEAGIEPSDRLAEFLAYLYCDGIHLLVDGAQAGGGFAPDQVRAGMAAIGPSFRTAVNLRPAFSTDRADGAGAVRDVAWDDACSCFTYIGDEIFPT